MSRLALSRSFVLLWIGQMLSGIGSRLSSFALGLWVLRTTGSTTQFAITFIVTALPAIFAAPLAGALVDRWDRRRILMTCEVLSALLMGSLVLLLSLGHLAVWHVYAVAAMTSLLDSFRNPAFLASVPRLVAPDQLPRANGLVHSGEAAASIAGPLLAGFLVATLDFRGVLLIDASTFVIGLITLSLIAIPRAEPAPDEERQSPWREAQIGWRYVRDQPGLLGLLKVYGYNHFVFAVASVLIAPLLLSFTTAQWVGVQYATSGAGLLLGGLAMTLTGGLKKRIDGVLVFSMIGGVFLAAHGVYPAFALVVVCGFVLFTMLPAIDASNNSLWQSKVPAQLQGRCFAIQELVLNAAMAVGYCLAGPLSDYVFEPALREGGWLAGSVGWVIGVGPGRGIGLMFVLIGLSMSLYALRAYLVPAIRRIDEIRDVAAPEPNNRVLTEPSY
ncbi:MFS transporter [Lysobacter sp. K5869]|uniref:MFS transporter n=1 Tax=Lysobacter sp. K5869 TaxID=2820808 RepID=UPI001C064909|nr:MFS transporter [Lysobacter sp. K5869]QWP77561.1 MFS transporter [Lysobacter sp. K5869]